MLESRQDGLDLTVYCMAWSGLLAKTLRSRPHRRNGPLHVGSYGATEIMCTQYDRDSCPGIQMSFGTASGAHTYMRSLHNLKCYMHLITDEQKSLAI